MTVKTRNQFRTCALALVSVFGLTLGSAAHAADIFVRKAYGSDLSKDQADEITFTVRRAVSRMPEHHLVNSEDLADFVLQASVVNRRGNRLLRVEKLKDGDLLAASEDELPANHFSTKGAEVATETALQNDDIASYPTDEDGTISGATTQSPTDSSSTSTATTDPSGASTLGASDASPMAGGEVRGPSPLFSRPDRMGAFQIGVGPAFGLGMNSDQVLYDITLGYAAPVNESVSIKGFGDLNLASGGDANRFLNFGVGADIFPLQSQLVMHGQPYLSADAGYAFTRDRNSATQDGIAVGAGGGFKFMAQDLNMDVNLHYTILTAKLQNDYPSVFGIRAAFNF